MQVFKYSKMLNSVKVLVKISNYPHSAEYNEIRIRIERQNNEICIFGGPGRDLNPGYGLHRPACCTRLHYRGLNA